MNARELAQKITKEDLKNQHIGDKTPKVLEQELFSLLNSFTPDTWTSKELSEWYGKHVKLMKEIGEVIPEIVFVVKKRLELYQSLRY